MLNLSGFVTCKKDFIIKVGGLYLSFGTLQEGDIYNTVSRLSDFVAGSRPTHFFIFGERGLYSRFRTKARVTCYYCLIILV